MSDEPGFAGSGNAQLSALRILDEPQFVHIIGLALARHRGFIINAAKSLKVNRNTLGRWIKKYPELGAELIRIRMMYETKEET